MRGGEGEGKCLRNKTPKTLLRKSGGKWQTTTRKKTPLYKRGNTTCFISNSFGTFTKLGHNKQYHTRGKKRCRDKIGRILKKRRDEHFLVLGPMIRFPSGKISTACFNTVLTRSFPLGHVSGKEIQDGKSTMMLYLWAYLLQGP